MSPRFSALRVVTQCALLHHAARIGASAAIVSQLVAIHPDACKQQDTRQMLPLHYALSRASGGGWAGAASEEEPSKGARGADVEVLEALLQAYPEGRSVGFGDRPMGT